MEQVGSGEANVRTRSTVETPKPPKFLLDTPLFATNEEGVVRS